MNINIGNIRREYIRGGLKESDVPANPIVLFEEWLEEAIKAEVNEPTAMLVATVSPEGQPASRTVLLKEIREGEFVFYTNYESRKGNHLANNPRISLSFVWHELERQVHVEGMADRLPPELSDAYFKSRPYKSRVGARISPQSQPITGRMQIIKDFVLEMAKNVTHEIERPGNWGGYAVSPVRIEFWQGRANRLHDRILYNLKEDNTWRKERLAP